MPLLLTLRPDRIKKLGVCLLWMLCAGSAHAAVYCTATMTNVAFGDVDLVNKTGTSTTGTFRYVCENTDPDHEVQVKACFLIDGGQGHQTVRDPSYMANSGNQLNFNLFWPNGSTVWTNTPAGLYNPPVFTILKALSSNSPTSYVWSGSVNATLQLDQNVPPNTSAYQNSYAEGSTAIAWSYSNVSQSAPSTCGRPGSEAAIRFPFSVSATVIKSCKVTANTLDFGTAVGSLTNNIDNVTTLQATCSNTTPYQIGLDNGQNFSVTRRMTVDGSEFVNYELFRNAGRSQRWGNTPSTDTVAGIGTGIPQTAVTVYGRVAPQMTPSPGDYSDTVTVLVNY